MVNAERFVIDTIAKLGCENLIEIPVEAERQLDQI